MPMFLNEDQTMLRDSAREFLKTEAPVSHMRKLRDEGCKDGFRHALWKQFGEMGFTGILIGEDDGGLGLGHVEAGVVLEEIGRNLSPSPFLTTAVAGVSALNHGGQHLKDKFFPGILAGETVLALAIDEHAKHRPAQIATKAEKSGNGFKLSGKKQFVVQGASADALIVAARTAGAPGETDGITLFVVDKDSANLSIDNTRLVDSSMAAHVTLDGVEVDGDAVIGDVDNGWQVLSALLKAGRAGSAAELVGVGSGAMDMTVDYLKQRKQFGRLIGEFQALQHRAAHLYSEMEIARAAVLKAQQLLDEGKDSADIYVSVAKAKAGRSANLAVREGVQMHGGIGMTDEYDIGFYMKRDRALNEFMGDANFHAGRVAEIFGY
ncbi:MAG: acyl-CoA dehydrogenase [Sphingomonadales bacterium RIFCSPHIGHO2_01_FULL_65_20]|uniref:Acyl-CoA dehydrogenase n=1 Tax=Sphingomonas ursincola TaxID=56361 RepID=A0A7V8U9K4_9SPHN|nr:acyl-CoA dehydrogenase [Sphingomonas ursincola]MBA1375861.1 acyl-CoA dehydrogenase [Sphingomonas ursincola]MBA4779279.1 acyl-CoA dehydrogenase [Blastomonas sp.]MCH2236953.1 acyl-CoA dehydrogenase [Blastomonas sp.]OHC91836.1 MAG: acyl-CoA dehydrogenase [Sphingomonadales bacterium RIFCSPHIGHO2_01_FULL_65_20]